MSYEELGIDDGKKLIDDLLNGGDVEFHEIGQTKDWKDFTITMLNYNVFSEQQPVIVKVFNWRKTGSDRKIFILGGKDSKFVYDGHEFKIHTMYHGDKFDCGHDNVISLKITPVKKK